MKNNENQQRRDKWRVIIEEYLQSSLTQKAFCEQRGLSLPQLVYYHSQFRTTKTSTSDASFMPVKISNRDKMAVATEIKLSLPNGFQCVFPTNTDATQIKQLIEVLLSC